MIKTEFLLTTFEPDGNKIQIHPGWIWPGFILKSKRDKSGEAGEKEILFSVFLFLFLLTFLLEALCGFLFDVFLGN